MFPEGETEQQCFVGKPAGLLWIVGNQPLNECIHYCERTNTSEHQRDAQNRVVRLAGKIGQGLCTSGGDRRSYWYSFASEVPTTQSDRSC